MKIAVSSWSYRTLLSEDRMDLLGFVDEVARLGADGLEILPGHVDQEDFGAHLKEVAQKAGDTGLGISALIAGNNFALPSVCARAAEVERMKQKIEWAAEAGIWRLNTFTGYHVSGEDPVLDFHRVVDCYRDVAPVAEQHGVTLCIENHSSVCADADGLLHVIRMVDSDSVRTNPDPSNFVQEFACRSAGARERIYSETAKLSPLATNAHLKIGEFDDDGEHAYLDVGRIVGIWREAGYNGYIALEVYGAAADAPAETCAKGIALLRKHI